MRWLVRRVLVLWVIMLVLCGAVALLVRLNREPGPLQALGFDMCDGEPCWRGIKPGTDWEEARSRIPDLVIDDVPERRYKATLALTIPLPEPVIVTEKDGSRVEKLGGPVPRPKPLYLVADQDGKTVEALWFERLHLEPHSVTLGNVVAKYGPPCKVEINRLTSPWIVRLFYSRFYAQTMVEVYVNRRTGDRTRVRFQIDQPVLVVGFGEGEWTCNKRDRTQDYPWRGFTSDEIYLIKRAGTR
jgi:hypothetical protein